MKSNNLTLFVLLILLCVGTASSSWGQTTSRTNKKNRPQAWVIIQKMRMEPLSGATQAVIEKAKKFNAINESFKTKKVISDSLYLSQLNSKNESGNKLYIIVNLRDSVMYTYSEESKTAYHKPIEFYFKSSSGRIHFTNVQYPNATKSILGIKTQKVTYEMTMDNSKSGSIRIIAWYAPDLPNWMLMKDTPPVIPGFPLKMVTIMNNHLKMIAKAVSIKQVVLSESDYFPPEEAKIIGKTKKEEK